MSTAQQQGEASALPTAEELASLDALTEQWRINEAAIATYEAALKDCSNVKIKLETDLIPSLMASAGNIDRFKLADGTDISIKDELYASVSAAKQQEAFAWLEANGHADVIKDELKIALGRGDTAKARAEALIAAAEAAGISEYSRKRAVHPGTLQALLKEQLAEGVDVPKETFGVYQQRRAVIKLPK